MKNKSIKVTRHIVLMWVAGLFLILSCRKTEFMPDIVGEQVPYQNEATQDIGQLLAKHSETKVFLAAWQKSNISALIKAQGIHTKVTVLASTDKALKQAGITAETIQKMTTEELNEFIQFYCFWGELDQDKLGKYSLMSVRC